MQEENNSHGNVTDDSKLLKYNKFEDLFENFIQANSSKSIYKCFEILCKSLKINRQQVFENGYSLHHSQNGTQTNSITTNICSPNSRFSYGKRPLGVINRYPSSTSNSTNHDGQQSSPSMNNSQHTTRLIYQIIKSKTNFWKANELWKKYDKRANQKEYAFKHSSQFKQLNIMIIGCGPVGLRLSIECALLGHKCTIVEKRDRFSRNNVLHLWPFTIIDLKNLGAKLFYGKFCAGSIDHISIRKLQCVLLKVALLMGVQINFNTSFEELIEPSDSEVGGWRVRILPENHPLSTKSFDVVIGADGRRNSLPGFNRKEFRGRLAIGITANFVNYNSAEEAEVQERSGVAFIFDQKFFLDLRDETGIDLENIVYYKDDTHYFVMTAKRQSLIDKGVIKQDFSDATQLLSKENVNFDKLCDYAKEAAYVSTNKKLYKLDFAKNHYGQADVAMFDFTSLFQSENASRIVVRKSHQLLMALVGDSLLEPFWPLGTGIARGFLAAFDTAWQIRRFGSLNPDMYEILCERESIYQLLSQTTHDNVNKNFQEYTIDPSSRYVNLNWTIKNFQKSQIKHLYDIDANKPLSLIENTLNTSKNKKSKHEYVHSQTLLHWCQMVVQPYNIRLEDFTSSWKDGYAFAAIINRFRSDLIDYNSLTSDWHDNMKRVFDVMRNKLNLNVEAMPDEFMNANGPNKFTVLMILDKLYSVFKSLQLNEIDFENSFEEMSAKRKKIESTKNSSVKKNTLHKRVEKVNSSEMNDESEHSLRRNSLKHINVNSIASLLRSKMESHLSTPVSNNGTSVGGGGMRSHHKPASFETQSSTPLNNNAYSSSSSSSNSQSNSTADLVAAHVTKNSTICYVCEKKVYLMERQNVMDFFLHANCFRCQYCSRILKNGFYSHLKDPLTNKYQFFCTNHHGMTNKANELSTNKFLERRKSFQYYSRNSDYLRALGELPSNPKELVKEKDESMLSSRVVSQLQSNEREKQERKHDEGDEFEIENEAFKRFQRSQKTYQLNCSDTVDHKNSSANNVSIGKFCPPKTPERAEFESIFEDKYSTCFNANEDDDDDEEEDDEDDDEDEEDVDEEESEEEEEEDDDDDDENEEESNESSNKFINEKMCCDTLSSRSSSKSNENWRESKSPTPPPLPLSPPPTLLAKFNEKNITTRDNKRPLSFYDTFSVMNSTPNSVCLKNFNIDELLTPKDEKLLRDLEKERLKRESLLLTHGLVIHCEKCKKVANLIDRIHLNGSTYHRECVRCQTCNHVIKNADLFTDSLEPFKFYCLLHTPFELKTNKVLNNDLKDKSVEKTSGDDDASSYGSCSSSSGKEDKWTSLNEKYISKRKKSDEENSPTKELNNSNEANELNNTLTSTSTVTSTPIGLDLELIRKRAIEKAKLKSDEELGLTNASTNIKRLIKPNMPNLFSTRKESEDSEQSTSDVESNQTDHEELDLIEKSNDSAPLAQSETFDDLRDSQNRLDKISLNVEMSADTANGKGILKQINSKSATNLKELDLSKLNLNEHDSTVQKKRIIPNIELSDDDSSGSSSSTPSLNYTGSFNALNVTNSPRLSRNSRMVKLNLKRHKNDEKRMEKQRQDKRLRMSQDIQRKLDEIEAKLYELERDGVELEKTICSIDSNDLSQSEAKERLEQELYNLIHEKNILTRIENELNMQGRALAIEDKLSECQMKLRETMNMSEFEKTIEMVENEKKIMEKIMTLVEEKNHLVEQLESIRIIEEAEDSSVVEILSELSENPKSSELMNKYQAYRDII